MIVIEVCVLALLCFFGIREPIRKKLWRELAVFAAFFLFGSALLLAKTAGARLPFILDSIQSFFTETLRLGL